MLGVPRFDRVEQRRNRVEVGVEVARGHERAAHADLAAPVVEREHADRRAGLDGHAVKAGPPPLDGSARALGRDDDERRLGRAQHFDGAADEPARRRAVHGHATEHPEHRRDRPAEQLALDKHPHADAADGRRAERHDAVPVRRVRRADEDLVGRVRKAAGVAPAARPHHEPAEPARPSRVRRARHARRQRGQHGGGGKRAGSVGEHGRMDGHGVGGYGES